MEKISMGTDWMDGAACRRKTAHLFTPQVGESLSERVRREGRAIKLCNACGARAVCLEYAMSPGVVGKYDEAIWGGLTSIELKKRRRNARPRRSG